MAQVGWTRLPAIGGLRSLVDQATGIPFVVGAGVSQTVRLPSALSGTKALLVCSEADSKNHNNEWCSQMLKQSNIQPMVFANPDNACTIETVEKAISVAQRLGVASVAGVGGPEELDMAKAVAAVVGNSGTSAKSFIDELGGGESLKQPPLPLFLMPSSPGTLTDLTRSARVVIDSDVGVALKASKPGSTMAIYEVQLQQELREKAGQAAMAAALFAAVDSYLSPMADPATHVAAAFAIQRLVIVGPALAQGGENAAMRLMAAEAGIAASAAFATAPSGFSAGLGSCISARYDIGVTEATAAVGLKALQETVTSLEELEAVHADAADALDRSAQVAVLVRRGLAMLDGAPGSLTAPESGFDELIQSMSEADPDDAFELPSLLGEVVQEMDMPTLDRLMLTAIDLDNIAAAAEVDPVVLASASQLTRQRITEALEALV